MGNIEENGVEQKRECRTSYTYGASTASRDYSGKISMNIAYKQTHSDVIYTRFRKPKYITETTTAFSYLSLTPEEFRDMAKLVHAIEDDLDSEDMRTATK